MEDIILNIKGQHWLLRGDILLKGVSSYGLFGLGGCRYESIKNDILFTELNSFVRRGDFFHCKRNLWKDMERTLNKEDFEDIQQVKDCIIREFLGNTKWILIFVFKMDDKSVDEFEEDLFKIDLNLDKLT